MAYRSHSKFDFKSNLTPWPIVLIASFEFKSNWISWPIVLIASFDFKSNRINMAYLWKPRRANKEKVFKELPMKIEWKIWYRRLFYLYQIWLKGAVIYYVRGDGGNFPKKWLHIMTPSPAPVFILWPPLIFMTPLTKFLTALTVGVQTYLNRLNSKGGVDLPPPWRKKFYIFRNLFYYAMKMVL